MGITAQRKDYHWSYTDEPHATRRKEILSKYPQVKELYGHDPNTKWLVLFWVCAQLAISYFLNKSPLWTIVIVAYCVGGFITHALVLAMHEISHNLAFDKPLYNSLLGCFANLPTIVPHFSMFQKYHMEHHQYQGIVGIDSDVPSKWEGTLFTNTILKTLWVFFQPLFYIIRPLLLKPKTPGFWEFINWSSCFVFDICLLYFFGFNSFLYCLLSIFLGSGLHPVAGHFIAEHYVFVEGQETYSYYGPLNIICFNVGYHNEHHDFPRIPGSRLPLLRSMVPEYYDTLPSYTSWSGVIWSYITNPAVGPFSRVVRNGQPKRKDQ